jgi:hypothetical protein
MDAGDLSDLHEMMPGIVAVDAYPMDADSIRGAAVRITAAESRPIDVSERQAAGIELDVEACRFHLWVATFSRPVEVRRHWLIEEADGTQWIVASARLEMMKTRWSCECVRNYETE